MTFDLTRFGHLIYLVEQVLVSKTTSPEEKTSACRKQIWPNEEIWIAPTIFDKRPIDRNS